MKFSLATTAFSLTAIIGSSLFLTACTTPEGLPAEIKNVVTTTDQNTTLPTPAAEPTTPLPTISQQGSTELDDIEKDLDSLEIEAEDFSDL